MEKALNACGFALWATQVGPRGRNLWTLACKLGYECYFKNWSYEKFRKRISIKTMEKGQHGRRLLKMAENPGKADDNYCRIKQRAGYYEELWERVKSPLWSLSSRSSWLSCNRNGWANREGVKLFPMLMNEIKRIPWKCHGVQSHWPWNACYCEEG